MGHTPTRDTEHTAVFAAIQGWRHGHSQEHSAHLISLVSVMEGRQMIRHIGLASSRSAPTWTALLAFAIAMSSSLFASPALALCTDSIYVNNVTGSDSNEGCTSLTAKATIAGALATLQGRAGKVLAVIGTGQPYKEEVLVSPSDSGSISAPFFFQGIAAPEIRGSDQYTGGWTVRYADPMSTLKLWALKLTGNPSRCGNVVFAAKRYWNCGNTPCPDLTYLPTGRAKFISGAGEADTVFVNFEDPNTNHANDNVDACTRRPIRVFAPNVVVAGFVVKQASDDGILIGDEGGIQTHRIRVRDCVVEQSGRAGIVVANTLRDTVQSSAIHHNSNHGIYVKTPSTENCKIFSNACYNNDDQSADRGGVNGIRIGSGGTASAGNHLVEDNQTLANEDTGIEVNGSNGDTLRYNRSWFNGDHGFDHIAASGTRHIGDLAYGNQRDGMSIEGNSPNTVVRNCVMADDGRDYTRQDFELEVGDQARSTYSGDNNVLFRPARVATSCTGAGEHGENADSVLVAWGDVAQDAPPCGFRCDDNPSACFSHLAAFVAATGKESNSREGNPKFVSADYGNFNVKTSSPAVDGADTTVPGWKPTDTLGLSRYDCRLVTNTGNPSTAFADIGPYEHDDGAPTIHTELAGCTSLRLKWIARGESGDALPKPAKWEIFQDGEEIREDTSPLDPASQESEIITGLEEYQIYSFTVKTTDADGEVALSNTAYGTPCCDPPCEIERPGPSRAVAGKEDVDFPLALTGVVPNPSRGVGSVTWSIPRSQAGAMYDLSLFDLAGRRISAISGGAAKAGRFTEQLSFADRTRAAIPSGVFFLRLRIGTEVLDRTVVLTR